MKRSKIEIRGRELPVCSHGECERQTIWDFSTCWTHLTPAERSTLRDRIATALRSGGQLKGLILSGADLRGMDFSGANLSECFIDHCDLSGCRFVDANLRRAYIGWSNLTSADLTRSEIDGAVFTWARLGGVKLLAYSLANGRHPINITAGNFLGPALRTPKIDESSPESTEHTYRALKAYFAGLGDYDSASWAAYSERRMERHCLWKTKLYGAWLASLGFGLATGYGEKPARVFGFALAVVAAFAFLYWLLGSLSPLPETTLGSVGQALYFSVCTFCTFSAPSISVADDPLSKLLVASEAFLGLFTMGLFVFTLTRRYVSR